MEPSLNGAGPPRLAGPVPEPELVLCFPPDSLWERYGRFDGLRADFAEWAIRLEDLGQYSLLLRTPALERFPGLKQVVAAGVFYDPADRTAWLYRRAGTEGRLDGLVSCLVGGHVNRDDVVGGGDDITQACWHALMREVHSEVHGANLRQDQTHAAVGVRPLGWVNDDSTDVGTVHFGAVYVIRRLHTAEPLRIEGADLGGRGIGWVPIRDALDGAVPADGPWELEPWSRHVLEHLAQFQPAG